MIKAILKLLFSTLYRVDVKGIENYNKSNKKSVIISNHISLLDGLIIAAFLPDRPIFIIHTDWFKSFFHKIGRFAPINTNSSMIIKYVIGLVNKDDKCVIFPEGRISRDGSLMRANPGAILIADKTEADIIPMIIEGAQYTKFSNIRCPKKLFPKITLYIDKAVKTKIPDNITGKEKREWATNKTQEILTETLYKSKNSNQNIWNAIYKQKKLSIKRLISDSTKSLSTKKFIKQSFIAANTIKNKIKDDDFVGILMKTSVDSHIYFFALQALNKTPVLIRKNTITEDCIEHKVKTIITNRLSISEYDLAKLTSYGIKTLFIEDIKITYKNKLIGFISYCIGPKNSKADKIALIYHKKRVTHKELLSMLFNLAVKASISPEDRLLSSTDQAVAINSLMSLVVGTRVFLQDNTDNFNVISSIISDYDITALIEDNEFFSNLSKYADEYQLATLKRKFMVSNHFHLEFDTSHNL